MLALVVSLRAKLNEVLLVIMRCCLAKGVPLLLALSPLLHLPDYLFMARRVLTPLSLNAVVSLIPFRQRKHTSILYLQDRPVIFLLRLRGSASFFSKLGWKGIGVLYGPPLGGQPRAPQNSAVWDVL